LALFDEILWIYRKGSEKNLTRSQRGKQNERLFWRRGMKQKQWSKKLSQTNQHYLERSKKMSDKPVTREEKYLAYLTGDYTGEIPKPITRKEKYLYELCLKGIGGEISPEEIKAAVNEYLEKNPVKPGATTEQVQQIEQNKKDVASLKEDLSNKITKFYASNQGETHITDSDNGKIQDMMIYGKSSQNGTPTPENPVEIKNVVNPTVKVCGKNLWNPILGGYISGIDGSIVAASKKQIAATDFIKTSGKDITVIARNFSSAMEISYAYRIGFYNAEKKWIKNVILSDGNKHSINTFNITGTEYIRVSAPAGIYDTIQIEYGSEATPYEPYTEQSVQLPYTLNAIPVESGGNVTIDGQQYVADYVDAERGKLVRMVDSSKIDNTQSIIDKTEWLLAEPIETDLTTEQTQALKELATYYPVTNISVNSEQLDGYTVFNYPISMANGWNYVKQQLNDNRDYIYDMDLQSAEAYVNSEYAVALTELEV
jgi:hypothetical protein